MKKQAILLISIFCIFTFIGKSNSQGNTQGWNILTSYNNVYDVVQSNNKVYAATTGGLFSFEYNNPEATLKKYTNIDGLLNNELHAITSDINGNIWSGGVDGSINFFNVTSGTWQGINAIQTSTETSKGINGIFSYGRYVFFATDFSVVKLDAIRLEFIDQPYIYLGTLMAVKTPVYKVYVVNDTIWAATKNGIAMANINSNLPIATNWRDFNTINSPMYANLTSALAYFNNKMFFGTDSGMFYFDQNNLNHFAPTYNGSQINGPIINMSSTGNSLFFTTYKTSNNTYRVEINNLNNAQLVFSGANINALKPGNNGDLLIGTVYNGVNLFHNNTNNFIVPNGPFSNIFFYVAADANQNLWGVSGSEGGEWASQSGVYKFNQPNSSWKNYLINDYPVMNFPCCGYVQAYASTNTGSMWISGFGNGLLKINPDNSMIRYDTANSCLKAFLGNDFVLVQGVKEDNIGNLWILNPLTQNPIVNFTTCLSYPFPAGVPSQSAPYFLAIDKYNTKWYQLGQSEGVQGVCYLNENVPTAAFLSLGNLGANVTAVNDVICEKNGEIWVGTNYGVVIIHDPSQVINNPNSIPAVDQMRIIENGISTPLTENVFCLRNDALNNKWLGTTASGLLYLSPDGSTLLARYTASNSPLPDNKINSIDIDPKNGLLYVGTSKGLASFKTVAVEPLTDFGKITAGPNPYLIPNDKLLRIDGLVENSSVKILSISGKLIKQFDSPGGRIANWDGTDNSGNLVGSGIYIIVGYTKDGSKVGTGKVAVIRK